MRFLVLGCNGMAGHMISVYLTEEGHNVTGFARQPASFVDTICGDAQDLDLIKEVIKKGHYDSVVNCIGVLNQNAEDDKCMAVYMNSLLPHYLAKVTEDMATQIIHISTDCVFSGVDGAYTESALRDGATFYDRSKALGELEDTKNITLRNSIVGPDINPNGIGLLNWFMMQSGKVKGFTGAIWTGQTTLQLAKTVEAAAKERAYGLYNMVPDHAITKYDLLCLFNKYLRGNTLEIVSVEGVSADKSLKRTNFEFNYRIPDYEQMIIEMAEWMFSHVFMYPHYHLDEEKTKIEYINKQGAGFCREKQG